MACERCERVLAPGATVCPTCGAVQRPWAERRRDLVRIGLVAAAMIAIMLLWSRFVGFSP